MRKNTILFFFLIALVCQSATSQSIRGITLGLHSKDYHYNYGPLLEEISQTGAEWVSIYVKFYQPYQNSSTINRYPLDHQYWKQLDTTLFQAKQQGLKILLFPVVLIQHPKPGQWRGTINPHNKTSWYKSYIDLYTHLAQIAEHHKIELLSVGSEFCSLEVDTDHWTLLINHVRKIYTGKLSYSVNWDAMDKIKYYCQLDYIGVSAYFSLSKTDQPTISQLNKAWSPIKSYLATQQARMGIPLLFTEVGYTSQDGTNTDPWNYKISTTTDLEEQALCYQSLTDTWLHDELLAGLFFYDWFGVGGKEDQGYTLRQKPALQIAKQWFR